MQKAMLYVRVVDMDKSNITIFLMKSFHIVLYEGLVVLLQYLIIMTFLNK